MENKINELFDVIKNSADNEKYLNLILDKAKKMINVIEFEKNSAMFEDELNSHFEDLFEETDEPFDKIYKMDKDIRKKIKDVKIIEFEYSNDDDNNYIEIKLKYENVYLITKVSYKINGYKNDTTYFELNCENINIKYEEYILFDRKLNKKIIDEEYNKIFNDDMINKMYKLTKKNFKSKKNFEGFIKLLLTIPKIWYGYVY